MNDDLIEVCPICIENPAEYYTECGHCYCIGCLSRIKKCAMCRNPLQRINICVQIKQKVKLINPNIEYYSINGTIPRTNEYSFPIRPEDYQPSGVADFSRIDDVRIYATNYNVLRIMAGMGGLAYST